MAITHRTTLHWSGSGAGSLNLSGAVTETANAEQNRVLAIAAATPDQEFDLDFPFAALKSFFAISTQDVTIETNDGSAPDDTITLKAGVPVWWAASSSLASRSRQTLTAFSSERGRQSGNGQHPRPLRRDAVDRMALMAATAMQIARVRLLIADPAARARYSVMATSRRPGGARDRAWRLRCLRRGGRTTGEAAREAQLRLSADAQYRRSQKVANLLDLAAQFRRRQQVQVIRQVRDDIQ